MTRDQLEHAIRAACEVAEDTELIVFGSQAILGEYPDAPPGLRASIEVDVQPVNKPEAIDAIDGALEELSPFNAAFGFLRAWRGHRDGHAPAGLEGPHDPRLRRDRNPRKYRTLPRSSRPGGE